VSCGGELVFELSVPLARQFVGTREYRYNIFDSVGYTVSLH